MTDNGTFIVNGTERVIVCQMHRSPGRVLRPRQGQDPLLAASTCSRRGSSPIAARGSTSSSTPRTSCYVRIDRKRKLPATTLLYALDFADTEAKRAEREPGAAGARRGPRHGRRGDPGHFYGQVVFTRTPKGWARPFEPDAFRGLKLTETLVDAATGEVVAEAGHQADPARRPQDRREGTKELLVGRADLLGRYVAEDLVNEETGEIYAEAGEELTEAEAHRDRGRRLRQPGDAGDRPRPSAPGSATRWRSTRTPAAKKR